ncbi:MAG: GTP cyclohydrolase II [Nannocystaceae bacterium]
MPVPHSMTPRAARSIEGAREYARAKLPSRHGEFEIVSFLDKQGHPLDHVAIISGDVRNQTDVATRVHSECLTGDVFGSYRCDCRDQLELALARIAESRPGIVLYLRQEGRGIGIAQKVRTYELQERGLDTVEANHHLGFDTDLRDYTVAAAILHALGVASIELHTNNLLKVQGLVQHGIQVARRVSIVAPARKQNEFYLETKRDKCGHLL